MARGVCARKAACRVRLWESPRGSLASGRQQAVPPGVPLPVSAEFLWAVRRQAVVLRSDESARRLGACPAEKLGEPAPVETLARVLGPRLGLLASGYWEPEELAARLRPDGRRRAYPAAPPGLRQVHRFEQAV